MMLNVYCICLFAFFLSNDWVFFNVYTNYVDYLRTLIINNEINEILQKNNNKKTTNKQTKSQQVKAYAAIIAECLKSIMSLHNTSQGVRERRSH